MQQSQAGSIDGERLLTTRELASFLGVKPATIRWWLRTNDPRVPEPIRFGKGFMRWSASDVLARVEQLHHGVLPLRRRAGGAAR